jgi:hypothetical protein
MALRAKPDKGLRIGRTRQDVAGLQQEGGQLGGARFGKPLEEWRVLPKGYHDSYIDWAAFERTRNI